MAAGVTRHKPNGRDALPRVRPPAAQQRRPAELALAQSVSIRDHSRGSEDQYFGHPTCGGLDSQIRVFRVLRTMAVVPQKSILGHLW